MGENKPVVIYYRVSTKKQGESGLGLEAQRTYVQHFYPQEPLSEFIETMSGKDVANRPQLQHAIALCKKHKATLVVAKIDRLSRNTEQALRIYADLEGRLESCDIPNLDKFTLTLFMAIADRERELISLRTKAALDEKLKQKGEWRTASEPFREGKASQLGIAANRQKAQANENNRKAAGYIRQLRENLVPVTDADGKPTGERRQRTWREIAATLNSETYRTSRGGLFQAMQVQRLYDSA
ncbi:recombinase family protein [Rufibacter ruber]|uniref:recombinase family protein n=1 Tax=Rufibacter ruber TaxID=1783499 RepID=UPI00082F0B40|nr:recombinase family protein [Rufibacter ruber]